MRQDLRQGYSESHMDGMAGPFCLRIACAAKGAQMGVWMKELAGEFDELNELIYVADTETYELLYLNRRGLQVFGLKDPEQIKGRKCYEVLQGRQEPCDFCNNHLLSADTYLEWEIDNEDVYKRQVQAARPFLNLPFHTGRLQRLPAFYIGNIPAEGKVFTDGAVLQMAALQAAGDSGRFKQGKKAVSYTHLNMFSMAIFFLNGAGRERRSRSFL